MQCAYSLYTFRDLLRTYSDIMQKYINKHLLSFFSQKEFGVLLGAGTIYLGSQRRRSAFELFHAFTLQKTGDLTITCCP